MGSVSYGLGADIFLLHCRTGRKVGILKAAKGQLLPKAMIGPKSRADSSGTTLWRHVQDTACCGSTL